MASAYPCPGQRQAAVRSVRSTPQQRYSSIFYRCVDGAQLQTICFGQRATCLLPVVLLQPRPALLLFGTRVRCDGDTELAVGPSWNILVILARVSVPSGLLGLRIVTVDSYPTPVVLNPVDYQTAAGRHGDYAGCAV